MSDLHKLSVDGILPFEAWVQVWDEGRWVPVARSSSVSELETLARDEASVLGCARVVSVWAGKAPAVFTADPVDPEMLAVGDFVKVREHLEGHVWEYAGAFVEAFPNGRLSIRSQRSGGYDSVDPANVFLV